MILRFIEKVLEHPVVYTVWQRTHNQKKTAAIRNEIRIAPDQKVLDIGCGPGISAGLFKQCPNYVGVDINPLYTDYAARKYRKRFITADVCADFNPGEEFDWVLINSLFHHIPDEAVRRVLMTARRVLKPNGKVLLIDLVDSTDTIAKTLLDLDRGRFIRSLEKLQDIVDSCFHRQKSYTFQVRLLGVPLWNFCVFVLQNSPVSVNV